jgi:hypothetical protein
MGSEGRTHFARLASWLFFCLNFFSEMKILKRNPARQKKGPATGSTHPYLLQTGRRTNFLVIDYERTPYSDAHACVPRNLIKEHVFTVPNSRNASSFIVFFSPESILLTTNAFL